MGSVADMKKMTLIILGLLILLSVQVASAKTCEVVDVKSTIRGGAYDFLTDPSSSQVDPEDLRELYDIYSSSKDKSTVDCDALSEKSKLSYETLMTKIKQATNKQIPAPATPNSCSELEGYPYLTEEYCPGYSISASDTDRCCSQQGVTGILAVINTLEDGSIQSTMEVVPEQKQTLFIGVPEDAVIIEATLEVTPTVNTTIDVGADGKVDATIPAQTTETTPNLAPEINKFIDSVKNKEQKTSATGAAIRRERISIPLLFEAESTGNVVVSNINIEYVKPKISFFGKLLALIKSIF